MEMRSIPARGRTLDHAAFIYDVLEPVLLLGRQVQYDKKIVSLLMLHESDRVLEPGCGTGMLTRMIAVSANASTICLR